MYFLNIRLKEPDFELTKSSTGQDYSTPRAHTRTPLGLPAYNTSTGQSKTTPTQEENDYTKQRTWSLGVVVSNKRRTEEAAGEHHRNPHQLTTEVQTPGTCDHRMGSKRTPNSLSLLYRAYFNGLIQDFDHQWLNCSANYDILTIPWFSYL
jgi:hypothetical protein